MIEIHRKVLDCLAGTIADDMYDGESYYPFAYMMERTGLDRKIVRRACRALRRKGFTEFSAGLWSEDGKPAGAGYRITKAGERIANVDSKRQETRVNEIK
jgi:hypothetical protein